VSKLGQRMIASARKTRLRLERGGALCVHEPVDGTAIRTRLGLTQHDFAERFGIPVTTVREWEQRRRVPDAAAK
jgi:putative transcriptional regulator